MPDLPARRWLLDRLADYRLADPAERARHERVTAFVAQQPGCFSRALRRGHVVASAWVVNAGRSRVLLHHHKRLGRWLQFGGHVDGTDPNALAAARRELEEESGLTGAVSLGDAIFDLDVHPIPARAPEPAHLHFDVRFVFQADPAEAVAVSAESHALRWVDLDEVSGLTPERSVLRMVDKTRALPPAP
jgi:8-oxo-dGTP pyrophosphatase MutT (NUDIX family)